ncbi:hypothetical protein JST97_06660 [bacterium]|nr:hypothetical protein [bacterium]
MANVRILAAVIGSIALFFSLSEKQPVPVPRLSSQLKVVPDISWSSPGQSWGTKVYDENGQLEAGIGKRDLVLKAFGPPPSIWRENGREYWCYRLPPNEAGQSLYLDVCFESEFFLDNLTHFVLGPEKFVVLDDPNNNPSPPAELQF